MPLETQYNLKSAGVKRLMREALELANPTEEYYACPLDDNLFEWHFTVRGPTETEFEGGFYHGRILLPPQYPMQPPNIILLTPNGRFEVNKKICLSISGHHPETWQPSWSIRTALLALIAFMPTKAVGTIGSLDYSAKERQVLAKKSKQWECPVCGRVSKKLLEAEKSPVLTQEESSMLETIALKTEEEGAQKDPVVNMEPDLNDAKNMDQPKTAADITEAIPFSFADQIDSTSVKQRNVPGTSNVEQSQNEISDDILRTSIERSRRDKFWTGIVYIIIALIAFLIIRRTFFL